MATKTEDRKIYEPEYLEETPLPEAVIWENIVDAPKSVADLNAADGAALSAATIAIDGLGALAYEDLVNELNIAAGAVTTAKIAIDAIQGAVIAAGAITTTKISDGAIETGKLAANAVTAAKIAAGTITANEIAASTITAGKLNVSTLSAITANLGTINAGSITGITITGSTLSTATSGQRVVLTSTLAQYYNSSGTLIMSTYASSNSFWIKGEQSASSVYLDHGTSGTIAFLRNGTIKAIFDATAEYFVPATNGGLDLGVSGANWRNVQHNGIHIYQGSDMPLTYWMQIESGSIDEGNDPGFSISSLGTGRFRITHNLGHTRYAALATAVRGSGAGAYTAKIEAYTTTRVDVTVFNDSGTAVDSDFMLVIFADPN